MGKLYRRTNSPYWWARWQDARGEPRRESTRTSDRKVAALFLSAKQADVIRASAGYVSAERVDLAKCFAEYLAERQPPTWSARWLHTVQKWSPRIIDGLGGPDRILADVTRPDVERARTAWLAGTDEYRKVKAQTVNRLTAIGSGLWKWAIARNRAVENVFAGHPRFPEPPRDVPIPDEAQLDAWLAAIRSPVIRRAAVVEADTGLRRSELERARVEDLRGALLKVVSSYERGLTKNALPGVVPLTRRALAAVREQIGKRKSGPIFGHLPEYRTELTRAAEAAGFGRLRWHDLRHVALTRIASTGHALAPRALGRWRSGGMEARYVHATLGAAQAAVDALSQRAASVQPPRAKRRKNKHRRRTRTELTT